MSAHQKDEEFRQFSLSAHPLRLLLTVCGPLAIYQAFQQIFTILDTIMAAHVSADAVSAIAVLAQITLMIQAVGTGLAVGGCIKISEAYGQGDYDLVHMPSDEGAFRFTPSAVQFKSKILMPIFHLSFPVTAEKMLFAAGKVTVNSMAGVYGKLTAGALGVSNNIGGLTTNWHSGMLDGASSVISQNRGAGKYRRTERLFCWLLFIDVLIGVIGLIAVNFSLPFLARVFAQSREQFDQSFCDMIISIHRWEMLGYITLGVNSACNALMLGYGYAKRTMLLNMARVFVFRIPVLWYLQNYTRMGTEAVGVTMMVSNIATGICSALVVIPVVREIRRLSEKYEVGERAL